VKKIRYAVVGLQHGLGHAAAVRRLPGGELAGLCDIDGRQLDKAREAHGLARSQCHAAVGDLLGRDDVDAVVVATPPHTHRDVAAAVLAAGKHLLLEKPLAHSVADGLAIVEAAESASAVSQVAFCVRSSQWVAKCRQVVASGQIGEVVLMWYHLFRPYDEHCAGWRTDLDLGGGMLLDCGCHYLDMMCYLAGGRFRRVCAFAGPVRTTDPQAAGPGQVANVIIEMDSGVKLTLNASEVTDAPNHGRFGIVGTRGKIEADPWLPEGAGSLTVYGDGGLYETQIVIKAAKASTGHLGFFEQHQAFYSSITDRTPVVCTPRDALDNLLLLAAIRESIDSGSVVAGTGPESSIA